MQMAHGGHVAKDGASGVRLFPQLSAEPPMPVQLVTPHLPQHRECQGNQRRATPPGKTEVVRTLRKRHFPDTASHASAA